MRSWGSLMSVWGYRSLWNLKLNLSEILQTNKGVVLGPVKGVKPLSVCVQWKGGETKRSPDWFLCECWLRMVSICVNQLKQWLPVSNSLKPGANHWYLSCKMAHIPRVTVWLLLLSFWLRPAERQRTLFKLFFFLKPPKHQDWTVVGKTVFSFIAFV